MSVRTELKVRHGEFFARMSIQAISFIFGAMRPIIQFMNMRVNLLVMLAVWSAMASVHAEETPLPASVEANMLQMDTDHDGMVTLDESRAYLEKMRGKEFANHLFQKADSKANSKSCDSPFSRPFY